MHQVPTPSTETRHRVCVGAGGVRLKHAETELTLSDEGIAYELEGRAGLRRFADLRSVRLQAVNVGPEENWGALAELSFARGLPLTVLSSGPWGTNDPERAGVFAAFVEDLHRRLIAGGHRKIAFRRGLHDGRHRFLLGVAIIGTVIFGGAGLLVLYIWLSGKAGFLQVVGPLAGLGVFGGWIWNSVARTAPGTYDPCCLPGDIYPR